MGTNFYARQKLKEEEKKKLHQRFDEVLVDNFLERSLKSIHLGKRSYGWQFLWEYHPDFYQDNLTSIMEFLLSGEYEIWDEYGDTYNLTDFLENEIGDSLYSGLNYMTYMKTHPSERPIPPQYMDWITSDGLRFVKGDFS